jgi:pimeloyl-ACP methyl ester carboxylesterase
VAYLIFAERTLKVRDLGCLLLQENIAYDITNKGPAIIFQHGFLSNRLSWHGLAFVDAFKDQYTVICIDSLGHGDSDKPDDAELYVRQQRAADVIAVLDAEGIEKAHYVGYSMGGWLGIGCLAHYENRLVSLTIGGFDPFTSGAEGLADISLGEFLQMTRQAAAELVEWVTAEVEPGLAEFTAN